MKKPLLALACLSFGVFANAQTVIFSDNFDSFTTGLGVAEQNPSWTTWDGSAGLDGEISSAYAFSGTNSALIQGTNVDLVLPIGPYTSGKYDLKFKMLTTDAGGYFNLLHQWASDNTNYEWACDVFLDGSGVVTWTTGGDAGGDATVNLLEWFDVQVTADLDSDIGKLYINGEVVSEWQWSLNNADGTAGVNQLMAVDFYGTNTANGSGLYYIDDVQLIESTGVYTAEALTETVSIYPNPANDILNIVVPNEFNNSQITIHDLSGKIVVQQKLIAGNNASSLANLSEGIYIVEISNLNSSYIEKLIIQ